MRRGLKSLRVAALAACLSLAALAVISINSAPAAPAEKHPHIHKAIEELKEAKKELKAANHDFGGHRVAAMAACDEGIKQLELALKFDKN